MVQEPAPFVKSSFFEDYPEFDPTQAVAMHQEIRHSAVGKTPSGFIKLHAEMRPADLMKLIGYDPRSIQERPKKGKDPQNISPGVIDVVRSVQRSIDQAKVDQMVEYLYSAIANRQFADWSEIDVITGAQPNLTRYTSEHVVTFPNSADYFITDGQHRYCAILDFVRKYPELEEKFTQAIAISVLPTEKLTEWAGQSFHDKNYLRTAVKMTKALAVDSRDPHNALAKELRTHQAIRTGGGVNEVKDSLAATAKEFATHAVLYKFTRGFCEGRKGLDKGVISQPLLTETSYPELRQELFEYLTLLHRGFPNWTVVPGREEYLFRSSAALQALGVLGHLLYRNVPDPSLREKMIAKIGERKLKWGRTNTSDWSDVIGQAKDVEGSEEVVPASSRQAIDGTIKLLKERSGLNAYLKTSTDEV